MVNSFAKLKTLLNSIYSFPIFTTIVIISIFAIMPETIYAKNPIEITINSKLKLKNKESIKVFIRTADSVIRTTLVSKSIGNQNFPRTYIVNIVSPSKADNIEFKLHKDGVLSIKIPKPNGEIKNSKYALQIIGAIILKYSTNPVQIEHISNLPPWLIHGLLGKVKNRLDKSSIPGMFFVPAVHAFISSGENKTLLKIVESNIIPNSGPGHQLFVELSRILLESIKKLPKWRDGIYNLIYLSSKSGYMPTYFEQIFAKKVNTYLNNTRVANAIQSKDDSDYQLEKWFSDCAIQMSVNVFNPANAALTEKLFRKIEIVNYPAKVEDDNGNIVQEERYCKLIDIPNKKAEIINYDAIIKNKEYELALLSYSVPYSFQPSIFKIKKALIQLRINNDGESFKKEYEKEKNNFYNNLSKQYELETYLKESELKYVPTVWKYRYEIQEIKNYKNKKNNRWQALTKYLDTWESKLINATE
jgi:hypothetical protein